MEILFIDLWEVIYTCKQLDNLHPLSIPLPKQTDHLQQPVHKERHQDATPGDIQNQEGVT